MRLLDQESFQSLHAAIKHSTRDTRDLMLNGILSRCYPTLRAQNS